jgi:hypothetical protein
MFMKLIKKVFCVIYKGLTLPRRIQQENLDAYITSRNPKTEADVEKLIQQYMRHNNRMYY